MARVKGKMEASEELGELVRSISNPYLDDWKRQGKPVVGYFCSYIPEEILHSAGILPYRIGARGCRETTLADAVMAPITCSFARCCLELALRGEYGFLDGLVSMNGCENMRRMCDNWVHKVDTRFFHFISVPYKSDEDAVEWYKEELYMFKDSLEKFFDVTITNEKLRDSVQVCNETRHLLKSLYQLRKRKNPPLSGVEAQDITVMASAMPKQEYNKLLEKAIDEIASREGITDYRARLMTIGNVLDDSAYTRIIEELGGLIVTDASCFGTLSFWEPIRLAEEPLDGIARSYLDRVHCPRMPDGEMRRRDYIKEMTEAFEVDGIIFERMLYCNLWGGETISLEKDLQELNIPLLILDREYIPSGVGQLRTRVQAFLEMLERGRK